MQRNQLQQLEKQDDLFLFTISNKFIFSFELYLVNIYNCIYPASLESSMFWFTT